MMPKTALLFPGQGSQAVGMGADIFAASPAAREVLAEVEDALGEKLGHIMQNGPDDELRMTRNAQPALMTTALAVWREIESRLGMDMRQIADARNITAAAGHSLGEYAALAATGVFDIATAARLLRLRGEAMQNAVPVGEGAMAALLGVNLAEVQNLLSGGRAAKPPASRKLHGGDAVVDIANDNAPGQVVISGAAAAVDGALARARDSGIRKAMKLPVSAPFHCRLMQPAADKMAEALGTTDMKPPHLPIWCNTTAAPESDPAILRDNLIAQVTGMVRWRETLENMAAAGITRFVEIGTGKVLTGLVKRTLQAPDIETFSVETPADIDSLMESLA